ETSLLLCNSPIRGLGAGLGCFVLAGIAGMIASRLLGVSWGMFAAGLVLAWAAWGTGRVDQILRRTASPSTFWTLSIEGLIVGILGIVLAVLILGAGTVRKRRAGGGGRPREAAVESVVSGYEIGGAPGAAVAGLLSAFLYAAGLRRPSIDVDDGPDSLFSPSGAIGLVCAVIACAVGAWIIAREPLKGQTFAA